MVGVGLGLTMNIDIFEGTGLETNVGVKTNEFLETNMPDVWSAGDVAEFYDVVSMRHHRMGTWDNSLNHGRHVAKNMLGAKQPYVEVPTYASGMFDSNISVMGVTTEEEPDAEAIVEVDYDGRNYKRLFFLGDKLVGEEEQAFVVAAVVVDLDDRLRVGLFLGRDAHDRDVRVEHAGRVRRHLHVRLLRAEHVLCDVSPVIQRVVPGAHAVVAHRD